jgi:glucosamine--fructose-6-phosphate aminotransferase (isomerizing)
MIASETGGFGHSIQTYRSIPENVVCVIRPKPYSNDNAYECFPMNDPSYDITNPYYSLKSCVVNTTPYPHDHWMIREIHEQSLCVNRLVSTCLATGLVELPVSQELTQNDKERMLSIDHLIILGCGTSSYAGSYSLHTLRKIGGFDSVQMVDAYNFTNDLIPTSGVVGVLMLSQSGETKDLMNCLTLTKERNLLTMAVLNTENSTIAREADIVLYVGAGKEVAVASTKSFTGQVAVIHILSAWYSQERLMSYYDRKEMIQSLRNVPKDIDDTIKKSISICTQIASELASKHTVFILGKAGSESIAMEGCLKCKEVGYIHASGYNSSALRHGPFALLTEDTPVILLNTGDTHHEKNNIIALEVSSRNSPVIGVSDTPLDASIYSHTIPVGTNTWFHELLCVIPLQLLSYFIAIEKGHNPDFPRNLAKTITVD